MSNYLKYGIIIKNGKRDENNDFISFSAAVG